MTVDMESEDEALHQPGSAHVARRAVIVKQLHSHALTVPPRDILDTALSQLSPTERDEFLAVVQGRHRELLDALRRTGLWEDTTPEERRIFEVDPADIDERDRINVSWRAESLGCLAWSLGLVTDLPPFDTQFDPEALLAVIPDGVADFVKGARLRDREVIEEARELAELWHWRSRTRQLQEQGYEPKPGQPELSVIVASASAHASAEGIFVPIADDFPAFGKPYRDLSSDEWAQAQSIAMERHFGLNWLCGFAPDNDWDETPTDT
jgi:hypothetical protein